MSDNLIAFAAGLCVAVSVMAVIYFIAALCPDDIDIAARKHAKSDIRYRW